MGTSGMLELSLGLGWLATQDFIDSKLTLVTTGQHSEYIPHIFKALDCEDYGFKLLRREQQCR